MATGIAGTRSQFADGDIAVSFFDALMDECGGGQAGVFPVLFNAERKRCNRSEKETEPAKISASRTDMVSDRTAGKGNGWLDSL